MKWKEYTTFAAAVLAGGNVNNQVYYQDIQPDVELAPIGPWPWFNIEEALDVNHDGIDDFKIVLFGTTSYSGWAAQGNFNMGFAVPLNNNQVHIASSQFYDWCTFGWNAGVVDNVANYSNGAWINPTPAMGSFVHPINALPENQLLFMQRHKLYFSSSWYFECAGDPAENVYNTAGLWFDMSMRNVPVKFKNGGNFYTGWIRLSVTEGTLQVHDYAIALDPETSIIAGDITDAIISTAPTPGLVSTTPTKAYLNWSAVPDAIKYRFRYKKVTDTDWTTKVVTGTSRLVKSLTCGTSYEWQVQAMYDNTPNLYSEWSSLESFTTGACRLDGSPIADITDVVIYPNPATDQFTLEVITDAYYADMFIDILNLQGVRLKSLVTNSTNLTIDVQDLPAGTYMVVVHTEAEAPVVKRIVIQ